jgi:hypothetical protein
MDIFVEYMLWACLVTSLNVLLRVQSLIPGLELGPYMRACFACLSCSLVGDLALDATESLSSVCY